MIDLQSGDVVSAEALARWTHPELGAVSPVEFIPLAEETGLIVQIGDWSLETACAQNRVWREGGHPEMCISVNVSPRQFRQSNVFNRVTGTLRATGLDPSALQIEITERLMLDGDEAHISTLRDLRAIGVQIALDDFGTGYSSLSYLSQLPVDVLKIDRCFIRDIGSNSRVEGIVKTMISLAHELGMRVVAEGVDDEIQRAFLREHGCEEFQGFLFSPAVSPGEFARFL